MWSPDQLARLLVGNAVGAVLVGAGWYQCATADEVVRSRLTWLSVSIVGLAVASIANGLWMAGLRARVAGGRAIALRQVAELLPVTATADHEAGVVVAAPGMTRYHRPDCELALGKATKVVSERQRRTGRLRACEICC